MAIKKGMSADDVLKVWGLRKPKATRIVGDEGEERGVKNLIVEWTYHTIRLTLARREDCYRVIKIEKGDF